MSRHGAIIARMMLARSIFITSWLKGVRSSLVFCITYAVTILITLKINTVDKRHKLTALNTLCLSVQLFIVLSVKFIGRIPELVKFSKCKKSIEKKQQCWQSPQKERIVLRVNLLFLRFYTLCLSDVLSKKQ